MKNRITGYILGKVAFTLAEVLITLAIIGIVAAITIPTLISNYQKKVVSAKIQRYYSMINQAIKMSSIENGEPAQWPFLQENNSYEYNKEWLEKYILTYIKNYDVHQCTSTRKEVCTRLSNGDLLAFKADANGGDFYLFTDGKYLPFGNMNPKTSFCFQFHKLDNSSMWNADKSIKAKHTQSVNSIDPYIVDWDGTIESLKSGKTKSCYDGTAEYCTKLIQLNNWKIPDDYPW